MDSVDSALAASGGRLLRGANASRLNRIMEKRYLRNVGRQGKGDLQRFSRGLQECIFRK